MNFKSDTQTRQTAHTIPKKEHIIQNTNDPRTSAYLPLQTPTNATTTKAARTFIPAMDFWWIKMAKSSQSTYWPYRGQSTTNRICATYYEQRKQFQCRHSLKTNAPRMFLAMSIAEPEGYCNSWMRKKRFRGGFFVFWMRSRSNLNNFFCR